MQFSLPHIAFGKEKWKKCIGVDVGIEPPLPINIHCLLKSPCPIFPGKTIEQTHSLVLIPETVLVPADENEEQEMIEKPLTLELFGKLIQHLFPSREGCFLTEHRLNFDESYFKKYNKAPLFVLIGF